MTMATAITIFTIVTGTASVLGFVFAFYREVTPTYINLCKIGFGVAVVWSAYVLFIPGTSVENNVAQKIAYYHVASTEKQSDTLIIERGDVSFSGNGPLAIEFPVPFRDPPEVEVINSAGYSDEYVPKIKTRTGQQVVLYRTTTGGSVPEFLQGYRWVARGIPLDEVPKK
jgi:hypothetical protein